MQDENDPVLVVKLQERWHRRNDALVHYLYGYSVLVGRPGEGFSREALMDGSPGRTVPASHLQTIRAALSQAVRDHELAPVVQAVDFRKRTQLPT